jgi:IS5 family transposase
MSQLSFLAIGQRGKALKCERFLQEMNQVIPWEKMCDVIRPHYEGQTMGRPVKDLEMMLKIHCLQQWYNLSDPGMEEAIYDRNSFQKFLKIDLMVQGVPDESTILQFRHLLEKHNLSKAIFDEIAKHLVDLGLMMKQGTIVDATLIESSRSIKNKDKKRDPEMSSTRKGNRWYFGMKAHIGVDHRSGLVHTMKATTAKDSDFKHMNDLWHGEEKIKFGDKGYHDFESKRQARAQGILWAMIDRASRKYPLSPWQKKRNHKLSMIRRKVEHPFAVIKCLWGYTKTKYKGIYKNQSKLHMMFALYNLFKVRKMLFQST